MPLQEAKLMNYKDLKLISSKELENCDRQPNRESWLSRVWQKIVAALTPEDIQSLRVWRETDRRGRTWWKVSNPATNEIIAFDSETEVRIWMEEFYYRRAGTAKNSKPYTWQQIER